ncbi:hypothetical protein AFULGI_00016880 [Archaeoglobus fulgidus DSM 8774]|uniref:DUF262 domain-containing protein n=1 Tax=Archaeoglobus fulgidus DSM 8774 TaxID=1344584 RepID=A0A075WF72_ARCFL|nr:DUF262 domain-containing protein [Archaeoglobus fulgidus]AIG98447.1 hypothetical protein AFULGI_00016880 [Archaeoglobus fulgidus DSM 8774]
MASDDVIQTGKFLLTKVDKETVENLVEELMVKKNYLLPAFQREFVWDEEDIKDFIDSIIKGFPVGAVILWKPSRAVVENDSLAKPILGNRKDLEEQEVYYVLDGQQRLTALLLMFNNWKIKRDGEEISRIPISIRVSGEGYKLYKSEKIGVNLCEALKAFSTGSVYDPKAMEKLREKLDERAYRLLGDIARKRIAGYEIPIYILETSDEDETVFSEMAEAFTRVNRAGIRIGNVELILSYLAGKVSGSLKEGIISIYRGLENFKIDLQPVIRTVLSEFGIKQTDIKAERFNSVIRTLQNFSEDKIKISLKNVSKSIGLVADFLRKELGVKDTRILPSQIPLVTLAKYFTTIGINDITEVDKASKEKIEKWFILVSFNGYYSSYPDTKLELDLKTVQRNGEFPFEDLVENIKERGGKIEITREDLKKGMKENVVRGKVGKAYLFLLYILLVKNGADNWANLKIAETPFDDLAKHHIFPKDYLKRELVVEEEENMDISINNLANITFVDKRINSEIGDKAPKEYLPNYSLSLNKHFIPRDENLWTIETYEAFLEGRISLIWSKAKELYPSIFVG